MAKVEYVFPVDKVHGRISKQHKVGFSHRKATKPTSPPYMVCVAPNPEPTNCCVAISSPMYAALPVHDSSTHNKYLSIKRASPRRRSTRLSGAMSSDKSGISTARTKPLTARTHEKNPTHTLRCNVRLRVRIACVRVRGCAYGRDTSLGIDRLRRDTHLRRLTHRH